MKFSKSYKAMNDIKLYTGMSDNDIKKDLEDKQFILNWLVEKQIKDLNEVGRIISEYYINPKHTLKRIKSGDMEIKKDAVKPPMKPLPKPPMPPYKRKLETEH